MDKRPIGIYDSGMGGLTSLKTLRRLLPEEDIVFFADTGRLPYGPRPGEELCRFARQDMDFLARYDVKVILAACGTISSAAAAELKRYPVPAFGIVQPALDTMAALPGSGPLGVIATDASIRSGAFTDALQTRCPDREVVGLACPAFAPTVEQGHIRPDDPVLHAVVAEALAPLRDLGLAALLLACIHYGIIAGTIAQVLPGVPLYSAADCGALAVRDYLAANGLLGSGGGKTEFYISCPTAAFDAFASAYLEQDVRAVQVPVLE